MEKHSIIDTYSSSLSEDLDDSSVIFNMFKQYADKEFETDSDTEDFNTYVEDDGFFDGIETFDDELSNIKPLKPVKTVNDLQELEHQTLVRHHINNDTIVKKYTYLSNKHLIDPWVLSKAIKHVEVKQLLPGFFGFVLGSTVTLGIVAIHGYIRKHNNN